MKQKIFLIILFSLVTTIIMADCPHCFTVVNVKIVYNNGIEEKSNLKFFRSFVLDNNEITPEINDNIKDYFPSKIQNISLIDSIYKINNIPAFIVEDEIRKVALNSIREIILLEWTKIAGAGGLPRLSKEEIEKILKSKTVYTNNKIFSVYDEFYIYTDTILSKSEFDFFIENSYNAQDEIRSARSRLNINRQKNLYPSINELKLSFNKYFDRIDNKIYTICEIDIKEDINEYFTVYEKYLRLRKAYNQLLYSFLNTGDANNLKNFIDKKIQNEFYKKRLLDIIILYELNEVDIVKTIIELLNNLHIIRIDPFVKDQFIKIIKENNIIVLTVSWD